MWLKVYKPINFIIFILDIYLYTYIYIHIYIHIKYLYYWLIINALIQLI